MSEEREVDDFMEYLINDLDKEQLAVLYYQTLYNAAKIVTDVANEPDVTIDYMDLHNGNIDFLTDIIKENKEARH